MMEFKKAVEKEYEDCFKIVKKRISWMDENNLSHWNKTDYLKVYPLKHYKDLEDREELYVLKDDDKIVSFGALLEKDERWNDDTPSYYLHHLASIVSDKAYGKKFVYMAIGYALKNNKKYLRLDSSKNYPKLEQFYQQFGFEEAGECIDGAYVGVLRQLDLNKKGNLRKYIKSIELSEEYKKEASIKIEEKVLNSEVYKKAKSIFVYLATNNEVNGDAIINEALKDGKKVYVPKCFNDEMKSIIVNQDTMYIENSYGILEPLKDDIYNGDIDLVIIPCLSVSKDLHRLGHGKGYYDKYLKSHSSYKMALCFNKLMLDRIPTNENDVLMDEIISENI